MDHLDVLAKNIGHELRTPLLTIKSAVSGLNEYLPILIAAYHKAIEQELTIERIQPQRLDMLAQALTLIEQAALAASSYVNNLVTNLSCIDSVQIMLQTLSMEQCLQDAIKQFPYKSPDQALILKRSMVDFLDFSILANKSLLINLLFNLFHFALHHIREMGHGVIDIWTSSDTHKNYLHVKNTAKNLSDAELDKVFEPFDENNKAHLGLGLFFCKNLMDTLDGKIECISKDGFTEFVLAFPKIDNNPGVSR